MSPREMRWVLIILVSAIGLGGIDILYHLIEFKISAGWGSNGFPTGSELVQVILALAMIAVPVVSVVALRRRSRHHS